MTKKLNHDVQTESKRKIKPLRELNLMDDFLFDVTTEDLEACKIILNTKGKNDNEVDQSLVDFLHYVEDSRSDRIPDHCDERLLHLHHKIEHIKSSEQMEVTYMKMEERDRLIREEAEAIGLKKGELLEKIRIVTKKLQKGQSPAKIAEALEESPEEIARICDAIQKCSPDHDGEKIYELLK